MKMKKTLLCFTSIVLLLFCTACTSALNKGSTNDENTPILAGDTTEQAPIFCMVYFSLADEYYLVGQQHLVSIPETKRIEEVFLHELISGPKSKITALKPVINPNTRIVSISDNNGLLFVTLSSHFLQPLSGTPENWQENESWTTLIMAQRRLALYSIVNTLTQTGKYSKVQLYIDYNDDGQGQRPTRAELGFQGQGGDQLLEPIGRNAEIILNPDTSVKLFLERFAEKNWDEASAFVAFENESHEENTLSSTFSLHDLTLIDYKITSLTTSYDGKTAIVTIDYFIRAKDGVEYTNTNVALLIVRVDDIWHISYASINQFLNVSNG